MICFHCGRHIDGLAVPAMYGGNPVNLHRKCVQPFKADHITARATTSESGRTYADDVRYWSPGQEVVRLTHRRPGDEEGA